MIRVSLKALVARRARTVLTALAIVLGVGMVCAAFTLSDTLRHAADSLTSSSYRGTDAVVDARTSFKVSQSATASAPTIPAQLLDRVRSLPQVAVAAGDLTNSDTRIVDAHGKVLGQGPYFGVGYDPGVHGAGRLTPFRLKAGRFATAADEVVIDAGTAAKQHLTVGSHVRIAARGPVRTFAVSGIATFGNVDSIGSATFSVFATATAQQLFGEAGRYDSLLVAARPGVPRAALDAALAATIPPTAQVRSAAAQDRFDLKGLKQFISIIEVVLLVFGGVAIVVGSFTIVNTLSITVAQRSRELAMLRTIGASRRQVLGSVMLEALLLGAAASLIGLVAGVGIAKGLSSLLRSLGLDLPQAGTVFALHTALVAPLVGIVVTALAGIGPAIRATRISPVSALREGARPQSAGSPRWRLRAAAALASLLGRPAQRLGGTAGALARRNAMRNPGRTASTAAALMIGIALVVFVSVIGAGLRQSTVGTLEHQIKASYVAAASDGYSPIDGGVGGVLAMVPGVKATSSIAQDQVRAYGHTVAINGVEPATIGAAYRYTWKHGSDQTLESLDGDGAIVDESFAGAHHLSVGSAVDAETAAGGRLHLVVRAIDVPPKWGALGLGPITVSSTAFKTAFPLVRDRVTFVTTGSSSAVVRSALQARLSAYPGVTVLSPGAFAKQQLSWVDQVLAIIYVLLAIAVLVSLLGIVNTLALSVIERTRELGMLRAVGMTRRQVRRMIRHESVITALLGATLGIGVGLIAAAVVTSAFSGDGLQFAVPTGSIIAFVVVAVLAGLVAAIGPARRAARLQPLTALAYE